MCKHNKLSINTLPVHESHTLTLLIETIIPTPVAATPIVLYEDTIYLISVNLNIQDILT